MRYNTWIMTLFFRQSSQARATSNFKQSLILTVKAHIFWENEIDLQHRQDGGIGLEIWRAGGIFPFCWRDGRIRLFLWGGW